MKKAYNFIKIFLIAAYRLCYWKKNGATTQQLFINLGTYFLRIGAINQVGEPVKVPTLGGKTKPMYVKNIYFNFAQNALSATYSNRPIPKHSDKFLNKNKG